MKKNPELKKLLDKLDNIMKQEQYVFDLCIDGVSSIKYSENPNIHIVRFHVRSKKNAIENR